MPRSEEIGRCAPRDGIAVAEQLELAAVFVAAAARYWLAVFPRTVIQTRRLRAQARLIPDASLRELALRALEKRGNIEGAAAFAVLAPRRHRDALVGALVSFQALYNHVDLLAEQPCCDPVEARHLHEVLLAALDVRHNGEHHALGCSVDGDGGYTAGLVEACADSLRQLPSYAQVASGAHAAAIRIVAFQSLSLAGGGALERWANEDGQAPEGLHWWETAAAAGSSLAVYALVAAAADPSLDGERVAAIQAAYFPWIGSLHSLLDSLVDEEEDQAGGHLSLLGCYSTRGEAVLRMRMLSARSLAATRALPDAQCHRILISAMACNYLSAAEVSQPHVAVVTEGVRGELGSLSRVMLGIFQARDLAHTAAAALWRRREALGGAAPVVMRTNANTQAGVDA